MANWLFIAIAAQVILGTSAVFDKLLLRRGFFDPFVYTFWSAVLALAVVILWPWGFVILPLSKILLALIAGAVFTAGTFFFFLVLKKGEASTALPIIGGLAPIFTLFLSFLLLATPLGGSDFSVFILLVLGGLIFVGIEPKETRLSLFLISLASAFLFGIANVLTKIVFESSPFITGFIWMRIGGFLVMLPFLVSVFYREKIFGSVKNVSIRNQFFYLANRGYGALGGFMVQGAIFLAHPALVDATSSLKYVVIFIAASLFLKERFAGKILRRKLLAVVLIMAGVLFLGLINYARSIPFDKNRPIKWGVTFSAKFSRELGLDWQENFKAVLEDLRPANIRLVVYWDEVEKDRSIFDFSQLDWMFDKIKFSNTKVVLAVGMKVPRWPECHLPSWAVSVNTEGREESLRLYIKRVVERYKNNSSVIVWQVENEPFLLFGKCPERGKDFLDKEIALVKSIDPSRPVLVTDGGEFGSWYKAASKGDVFGTTMYRKAFPRFIGPIFGVVEYPIRPSFFRLKEKIIRWLLGHSTKPFLVIELQAEPWGSELLPNLSYEEQKKIFNSEYFLETINFAKQTGLDEYYLWGAEWWYWLKETKNNSEIWEDARKLFAKDNFLQLH